MHFSGQAPVVVFGATGNQGGAVVHHLLAAGHHVRAVTRHPKAKPARRLVALGAQVVYADLDEPATVFSAAQGAGGMFAVTDANHGVAKEQAHGKLMASVAEATGVRHMVLSTGASADHPHAVPHMSSKYAVESHVRDLGVPCTVLRPALFMELLADEKYTPNVVWAMLRRLVGDDRPIPWIAVQDIGAVASEVFASPDSYRGHTITLAGDRKTLGQCRRLVHATTGRWPAERNLPTWFVRRIVPDIVKLWEWLGRFDMEGDPALIRRLVPGALSFEAWLEQRHREAHVDSVKHAPRRTA